MIKAKLSNEELRADIDAFTSNHGFKVWWLGQSGFLIKYKGQVLLFDPYLSDSLSKKYANTNKPHVRISELSIEPHLLPIIDVVTSSHNHTDHLDAETLIPILKANLAIKFIIPEANRAFVVDRLQCDANLPTGINDNQSIVISHFKINAIPAAHNVIDRDQNGYLKYIGLIVEFGDYRIYHSGDTLWYEGLDSLLKEANLTMAFLPINGNKPERKVAGNLNYDEAAKLGSVSNIELVIPHHYDLFEFNTEEVGLFENKCREYGTRYKTLMIGEGVEIG